MWLETALKMLVSKLSGWLQQFILLLPNLAIAVIVVIVFWLLARLARNLVLQLLGRVSPMEEVNRLLGTFVFLALFSGGVFMALGIVELDKTVTSLLAGAGILALALGFACQDIASNFIAGIFLSIRRPFQTGHLIETNHFLGTVERISLRSTELRTPAGTTRPDPQQGGLPNSHHQLHAHGETQDRLEGGRLLPRRPGEGQEGRHGGRRGDFLAGYRAAGRALLRRVRGQFHQLRYSFLGRLFQA
jgi:small conductance mechanosensitive channel